jgi:hypothetical protein
MRIIIPLLTFGAALIASEFKFDGSFRADLWTQSELDSESSFKSPNTFSNHDILVNGHFFMDEGISASLSINTHSKSEKNSSTFPYGRSRPEIKSDQFSRPEIYGYSLNWDLAENARLSMGYFPYSFGGVNSLNIYSYKKDYSSVIKERFIHGFSVKAGGIEAYVGIPDTKNRSLSAFANYQFRLADTPESKFFIKPMIELTFNQGRNRNFIAATDFHLSGPFHAMEYTVDGSFAILPHKGDNTYSILVEPSLRYGFFSLGSGLYHAWLAKKEISASLQTDLPVQQFFYLEPLFDIHPKFSIGIPFSVHNQSTQAPKDLMYLVQPTFYLFPTKNAQIDLFIGYSYTEKALHTFNSGDGFMLGAQAILDF